MLGLWKRASDAERRASAAEDRASFLEQELSWLKQQYEHALADKDRANKIVANVFGQLNHGFTPFPEVTSMPEPKDNALPPDFFENMLAERPRDQAMRSFVDQELARAFPDEKS